MARTHEVSNQVPVLSGHDVYAEDRALTEAVTRHAVDGPSPQLSALGTLAGSEQAQQWANSANSHEPQLRTRDRYGHSLDEMEFHPGLARVHGYRGVARSAWRALGRPAT